VADVVTGEIMALFQVDLASVWLWDEANSWLARWAQRNGDEPVTVWDGLRAGTGMAGQAFATGRPVIVEDYMAWPRGIPAIRALGVASSMAGPIVADGQPIGVVVVGTHQRRHFEASDQRRLVAFADQFAPIAQGLVMRYQLLRRRDEALALADLTRQVVDERDVGKVLSHLAQTAASLLKADFSVVVALDAQQKYSMLGLHGVRSPRWKRRRRLRPGGVVHATLDAGKTLVLENFDRRQFGAAGVPGPGSEQANTIMATPAPTREGLASVIQVGWRWPYSPGPEDIRLIETLAAFGAGIVDSAQSHRRADELASWLQAIIDQMPSGVLVVDAHSRLSLVNRTGREILGQGGRSLIGAGLPLNDVKVRGVMRRLGLSFGETALARALEGEQVQNHEYQLTPEGRPPLWVRASATPLLDGTGRLSGVVTVYSDVTADKQAASNQEREAERRLALASIKEALSDASRDVRAMLRITTHELAHALNASCVVRVLEDGQLRVAQAYGYEASATLRALMEGMEREGMVADRATRHWAVVDTGQPLRSFDPAGAEFRLRHGTPIIEALGKDRSPLYAILIAPLQAHGTMLGTIGLYRHVLARPFTDHDESFVVDVGARAGLTLENARLFEQLASSRARLEELSQRLVQLQERERRDIALELHDEVGQVLTATRLLLESAVRLPADQRDGRLHEAAATLDEAVDKVRGLSLDLRPPMLERFGLQPALDAFFERFSGRTGIGIDFRCQGLDGRPPTGVETAAYRIIQEGLTNAARHAGVPSVEVDLWLDGRRLRLRVADAGRGFDASLLDRTPSTGLTGMRERAELLGGELTVESAPGRGTTLLAWLPLGEGGSGL
jgi:PAS domain S-box-containing protein